jgi:hypothetical protein
MVSGAVVPIGPNEKGAFVVQSLAGLGKHSKFLGEEPFYGNSCNDVFSYGTTTATATDPVSHALPISHTTTMAEMDVWFVFFDHDKPFSDCFLERLHPDETIMHFMRKLKAGDYGGPIANAKIGDVKIWKFRSLKIQPRDTQMDDLLSNLEFTDNEDSDVELVQGQTMMEELRLQRFEPLLVRVLQTGMQRLFLRIVFPTQCLK